MTEKYVPSRMCVVCRVCHPKSEMLRVVRLPDGGYAYDETGKASGRGAYVCKDGDCLSKCIMKQVLNRSFKACLPEEIYEAIGKADSKN